ncbi:MAG TPA: RagB/SusD family nutrient uptake outer membrane protein [Mucilaginibacter sp.]|nr:RagB/SusD family nutrient uptake outer membrane protein [Mucilaginibacter sp.]
MKKIGLLLLAAIAFSSCKKLDEDPKSIIVQEQFYQTRNDAISAVTAVYSSLNTDPGGDFPMYGRQLYFMTDAATDDATEGNAASNVDVRAMGSITYIANNNRILGNWTQHYRGINWANVAIDKISAMQLDTTIKNKLVRESKFIRALLYFNLVRLFGDVPLVLHQAADVSQTAVERAPIADVYKQIIADLTDAQNLPTTYSGNDIGRATGGAAKTLLAKVYLTRKDWKNTIFKSLEVINGPYGYALFDNYSDVFNKSAKNGKEHIFSIQFLSNSGANNSRDRIMTDVFSGFGSKIPPDLPADSSLYKSYLSTDTRKAVTFFSTLVNPATGLPFKFKYLGLRKYVDTTQLLTPVESGINFPVLRYADVLLTYAEALNEDVGPTAEAYAAINKVRRRAKVADVPEGLSQADFRAAIYQERRFEFVQEGHRWFDLVRTGRLVEAVKKVAAKSAVSDRNNLFPIPQAEIDVNPKVTQNPGW